MNSQSKIDTGRKHDVLKENFTLRTEDILNKVHSRKKIISHRVTMLTNLKTCRKKQSRLEYTFSFIASMAVIIVVVLLACLATRYSCRRRTSSHLAKLVSLSDYSPGFITLRDTCDQGGTSFVGNVFYTLMDGDKVTSEEACGIESTLKYNPNTTCYIMIFTFPTKNVNVLKRMTRRKKKIYTLIEKYDNAVLLKVDAESYFRATPLYHFWKHYHCNNQLIKFATRVLTIWQFGGTTYDSHLLTLQKNSLSSLPDMRGAVVMDLNHGLVMSAKQQCHAFLFEVVKVLAAMGKFSAIVSNAIIHTSEREVLSLALVNFCDEVQTTSNNGSVAMKLACAGVTGLPPELLCNTTQSDPRCTWGSSRSNTSESAVLCPVTAMKCKR